MRGAQRGRERGRRWELRWFGFGFGFGKLSLPGLELLIFLLDLCPVICKDLGVREPQRLKLLGFRKGGLLQTVLPVGRQGLLRGRRLLVGLLAEGCKDLPR